MIRILIAFLSLVFITTGCMTTTSDNKVVQCFSQVKNIDKDKDLYLFSGLVVETDKAGNHEIIYSPKLILKGNREGHITLVRDEKENSEDDFIVTISINTNGYAETEIVSSSQNKPNFFKYRGLLELNKIAKTFEFVPIGMDNVKLSIKDKFVIDNLK